MSIRMLHYLLDPAFVSALIGGVIVAVATLLATRQGFGYNRKMEKESRLVIIRGVLLAIRTELVVLWTIYREEIGDDLDKSWNIIPEKYFIVYESNCHLIGQIDDDGLRASIITSYLAARSLLNAHIHNNALIENCRRADKEGPEVALKARNEKASYLASLIRVQKRAETSLTQCVKLIECSVLLT
jgi:hypothetical protein